MVRIPGTNSVPLNSGTNTWYKLVPPYSGTKQGRAKRAPIFSMCARSTGQGGHHIVVLIPGTNSVPLNSGTNYWYKLVPLYSGTKQGRAKRTPIFSMCARSTLQGGHYIVVLMSGTKSVPLNSGTNY